MAENSKCRITDLDQRLENALLSQPMETRAWLAGQLIIDSADVTMRKTPDPNPIGKKPDCPVIFVVAVV